MGHDDARSAHPAPVVTAQKDEPAHSLFPVSMHMTFVVADAFL